MECDVRSMYVSNKEKEMNDESELLLSTAIVIPDLQQYNTSTSKGLGLKLKHRFRHHAAQNKIK